MTIIPLFITLCGDNRKGFADAECFNTTSMSQFLFPDALRARRWEPAPSAFLMKFMAVWMYNSYIFKISEEEGEKGKRGRSILPDQSQTPDLYAQ